MTKEVGGCHVCIQLVISNVTTKDKLEAAIEEIADAIADNPWLGLDGAVERLISAYEELRYVPD